MSNAVPVTPVVLGDLVYFWRHPEVTVAVAVVVALFILLLWWWDRKDPVR